MSPEIIQFAQTFGVPVLACGFIWVFLTKRIEQGDKAASEREQRMGARINELEDLVYNKLTDLVLQSNKANNDVAASITAAMHIAQTRPCIAQAYVGGNNKGESFHAAMPSVGG